MTQPFPMARFDLAWPLAAGLGAILSLAALGVAAMVMGLPGWLPLNATSHAAHGPGAGEVMALDLAHTGLGLVIHLASSVFWAGVAVAVVRLVSRQGGRQGAGLGWGVGLGVAALAMVIDYALLPAALSPGWELVLPPAGLVFGFAALGIGMGLGLVLAQRIGGHPPPRPSMGSRFSRRQ